MATERLPQAYAQAIYEQATQDWITPLKKAAAALNPGDLETLDNPGVAFDQKQKLLQRSVPANASHEVKNLLSLLASKNEMHLLPQVISEFERYAQRGPLRPTARVTSAVPLTGDERRALEDKMCARFGQEIGFDYVVDPAILGGVIVRVGDKVIDGSVSAKLAALRERLK